MRLDEFLSKINEVRMGKKELSQRPSIPMTFGFEAEIVVASPSNSDSEARRSEFDDRFDPPDEQDVFKDDFNFIQYKRSFDLTPIYGYPTEYEIALAEYKKADEFYQEFLQYEESPNITAKLQQADAATDDRERLQHLASIINPRYTPEQLEKAVNAIADDRLGDYLREYSMKVEKYRKPAEPSRADFSREKVLNMVRGDQGNTVYNEALMRKMHPEDFFALFDDAEEKYASWKEDVYDTAYQEAYYSEYEEFISQSPSKDAAFSFVKSTMENYVTEPIDVVAVYHGRYKNTDNYTLEPDSSIEVGLDEDGVEIVSPVYKTYTDGVEALSEILSMIRDTEGMGTNLSTGLHINIGFPELDTYNIDLLKMFIFLGDKHILSQFGREDNAYAQNYIDYIYDSLNTGTKFNNTKDITTVKNALRKHADKYRSVNLQKLVDKGYFEIRAMGGTDYEYHEDQIVRQINRFVRAITIAADPLAHKDEYLKKLYKLKTELAPKSRTGVSTQDKLIKALETDLEINFDNGRSTDVMEWIEKIGRQRNDNPLSPNTKILLRDFFINLTPRQLGDPATFVDYWRRDALNKQIAQIALQVAKKRGIK